MANTDYHLKIEGIEGESQVEGHKGEIQLSSWSFGETQVGTGHMGGGSGAGAVSMQDFHFTMPMNKASVKLALFCASGEHVKEAKLTCRKAGGKQEKYYEVTLGDCFISSYQTGGSSGSGMPMDQISINFKKVQWEYFEQDSKGTTKSAGKSGWDMTTRVKK